jgi:hypothetical protein
MYKAAEEQDWDKVLDEMGGIPGDASRQMVLLKNVALPKCTSSLIPNAKGLLQKKCPTKSLKLKKKSVLQD